MLTRRDFYHDSGRCPNQRALTAPALCAAPLVLIALRSNGPLNVWNLSCKMQSSEFHFFCRYGRHSDLATGHHTLPSSLFQTTAVHRYLKMLRMKTVCVNCYPMEYLSSWMALKCEGPTTQIILLTSFNGCSCHIHYINSGKVEQTTVEHFFCTFGDLCPSETRAKLKASFVVLSWISSLNVLAGLATGGSFPDWILGTIRGVYWRCSFPGHYVSQWGSQSRGTLSNKCSSPWLGYVLLILTGFLLWSLCFRAENV